MLCSLDQGKRAYQCRNLEFHIQIITGSFRRIGFGNYEYLDQCIPDGELSIAQQIPTYISTLTNTLINLFSPNLTMYYAKDDTEAVVKELKLSMKFSSFFVNIIFVYLLFW